MDLCSRGMKVNTQIQLMFHLQILNIIIDFIRCFFKHITWCKFHLERLNGFPLIEYSEEFADVV